MTKVKTKAIKPKQKVVKKNEGSGYGGKREGSGRKAKLENLIRLGTAQLIDEHVKELIPVTVMVTTPNGVKKEVVMQMPSIIAVLYKLRNIGMEGHGNWQALDKWICHVAGAPKVRLTNGEGDGPVQFTGIDIVVRE